MNNSRKIRCLAFASGLFSTFALHTSICSAAPGALDTTFGHGTGMVRTGFGGGYAICNAADEIANALALDSQGRAVLAGGAGGLFGVARLQAFTGPLLNIFLTKTNTAVVTWPFPSSGFALQQKTNLLSGLWSTPPQTVSNDGTNNFIVVSPPSGNSFFRLVEP